jgi:hypothetical protein
MCSIHLPSFSYLTLNFSVAEDLVREADIQSVKGEEVSLHKKSVAEKFVEEHPVAHSYKMPGNYNHDQLPFQSVALAISLSI